MRQDSDPIARFWRGFPRGVEVAVASGDPEKLLGVREGFLRYLHDGLDQPIPVVVVQQPQSGANADLAMTDEMTVEMARQGAHRLAAELGDAYHFHVGTEGGLHSLEIDGSIHHFVRDWAVVVGAGGEACGASGSIEIPTRLIEGLDGRQIPFAVPGTRRSGGMISSLTGRLETRRTSVATATFHALSTLFYGVLESRPVRRR